MKGRLTITHLMIVTALFGAMARFLPGIMQREPQLPAIVHLPLIVVHLPLIFSQMIVLAFPALVLCLGAAKWLRSRHCAELSLVGLLVGLGAAPAISTDWNPGQSWLGMLGSQNAEVIMLFCTFGAGAGVAAYLWWSQLRQRT